MTDITPESSGNSHAIEVYSLLTCSFTALTNSTTWTKQKGCLSRLSRKHKSLYSDSLQRHLDIRTLNCFTRLRCSGCLVCPASVSHRTAEREVRGRCTLIGSWWKFRVPGQPASTHLLCQSSTTVEFMQIHQQCRRNEHGTREDSGTLAVKQTDTHESPIHT